MGSASAEVQINGDDELHLVSWNVAGWRTTAEHLHRFGGVACFLQRHGADILCLQEVKLTAKAIAADATKIGADLPGYESFWACNDGLGGQRQGLNGVATIARKGLVQRADPAPLGDPALDGEGRCLLTDHGQFVVFNVYVPNTAGGPRLPFKMRWLKALRSAMRKARDTGKAVILCGDLNMKHRPQDSHWSARLVDPLCFKRAPDEQSDTVDPEVRDAMTVTCAEWPGICAALRSKEHRPLETRNSRNGQTFQRWGILAKSKSGDLVRLGPPVESDVAAHGSFFIDGVGVEEDGTVVRGADSKEAPYILVRPGLLSMGDLAECLKRLAGVELSLRVLKWIAEAFGSVHIASAVHDWFNSILREDAMADSFAELHPIAEERFTCWDQYKNKRHENVGSRIDFFLVDRSLFDQHVICGIELDSRGHERTPNSALAALSAATLGGLSQPSPFDGGGMPELEADEYFAHFRQQPGTGIIYTPPQLSDHVAVSLLLRGFSPAVLSVAETSRDAATLQSQPHRAGGSSKRITDFFAAKLPQRPSTLSGATKDGLSACPPGKRQKVTRGA